MGPVRGKDRSGSVKFGRNLRTGREGSVELIHRSTSLYTHRSPGGERRPQTSSPSEQPLRRKIEHTRRDLDSPILVLRRRQVSYDQPQSIEK